VGTRDETHETSGSLLALKNTYLKTLKHTNETINYGMIQMSGGDMTMDYDQEKMLFKGHCLEYDVIDMFQMMVDIALEPRSVLAANVAKSKNRKSHDLHKHLHKYDPFSDNSELLLRTAYGYNTLGMPRLGLEHNVESIDARLLQQFIMDNITPRKCLIVASGIKNHKEYVDLVKERLGELMPVPEHLYKRTPSEYIGGEYRTWTETPQTNLTLAFNTCQWQDDDTTAFYLLNTLVGNSQQGKNRASGLVRRHNFIDSVQSINNHFSDSGIFGISVTGAGSHSSDLLSATLEELTSLKDRISDEDL
jgi:predicted Zn-dependent peptidase